MKNVVILLISLSYFLFPYKASALYDPRTLPNNKMGVHILAPGEIESAAKLANSQGGDWGYITVPIQPSDRDKDKWQEFMGRAKELHLIPIIRITTVPQGGTWATGHDTDLVDFANFLGELDWPIENRYIVLFNEVNRDAEWGGAVDPAKYTLIVKNAYTIFKERSSDFFLLGPSLDLALPNSRSSLSATTYLQRMATADPRVWTYFDGWSSHSYPNPGFSAPAKKTGLQSIVGYKSELALFKLASKPIFITETGWDQTKVRDPLLTTYWNQAWNIWQHDPNVVSVTPFILQGGEQFAPHSLTLPSGELNLSGIALANLPKQMGSPKEVEKKSKSPVNIAGNEPGWVMPFFRSSQSLQKLENIFRVVLGLPMKETIELKNIPLLVEKAQTPKQWEKGLSSRTSLGELDGMLFIFTAPHVPVFWMKNMQFPLDMIWIRNSVVVDITYNAPVETSDKLPTYSPRVPVDMVLETNAGWANENNITIGDQIEL